MRARVLIVGCGSIGARYAHLLHGARLAPFCSWTSLWDIAPEPVADLAYATGATPMGSYEDGLQECDAVLICTWPASHIKLAGQALERQCKRMLIEKPLALTNEGIPQLIERASGATVSVSCNWRFHPSVLRALRECYAANEVEIEFAVPRSASAAHCGGLVLDLGSHAVDLASVFLGAALRIEDVTESDGVMRLQLDHSRGESLLRLSYSDRPRRWLRCGKRRYELRPTDLMYEYQLQRFLGTTNPPNPLTEAAATLDILLEAKERLACQPSR